MVSGSMFFNHFNPSKEMKALGRKRFLSIREYDKKTIPIKEIKQ